MSELYSFQALKQIKALAYEEQYFANYIFNNKNNFTQSDKPDLILQNHLLITKSIGIEHTEVSVFREGKKGAEIRRSQKKLNSELIRVNLKYLRISCVDIQPHYKRMLKLDDGRTFIKNIIKAINSKNKKSQHYRRFNSNILWIETEDFVEFNQKLLLNKNIKNALHKSPFDSILIGSSNITYYISKNFLKRTNDLPNEKLIINTNKNFNQSYKFLVSAHADIEAKINTTEISENIVENYTAFVKIIFDQSVCFPPVIRLFANTLELNVIKNEKKANNHRVIVAGNGEITTSFNISRNEITINHNLKAEKGDSFNLSLATKENSLLQQYLTGVINIIVQEDNIVEHYKYIPSQKDFKNWKISERVATPFITS